MLVIFQLSFVFIFAIIWFYMAFIEPMHCDKPNITYFLTFSINGISIVSAD